MSHKSREFHNSQELFESVQNARTEERPLSSAIDVMGIGTRRLQLIHVHSFEPGSNWEVYQLQDDWRVYRSVTPPDKRTGTGCERLAVESAAIANYFQRLCQTSVCISPDLSGTIGLDGETHELVIYGDKHSEIRFQWWCEHHQGWNEIATIYHELREYLQSKPIDNQFV